MYLKYMILFLTATPGDVHSLYPRFTENEALRGGTAFLMSPSMEKVAAGFTQCQSELVVTVPSKHRGHHQGFSVAHVKDLNVHVYWTKLFPGDPPEFTRIKPC